MMKRKIVIFGSGDIAQLAHFYFSEDSELEIAAFAVDAEYKKADEFEGLPVVAFEEVQERYPPDDHAMFVALSYNQLNRLRARKVAEAKEKGYSLASYISSRATVLTKEPIGENCFLLENNVIQPFAKIGNNVTLWSGNHVGHHSTIEDHVFVASHVVISGGVTIGEASFLGVNVTLRDHITIGKGNVLAAGALIVKDTPDDSLYLGSPAQLSKVPASRLPRI